MAGDLPDDDHAAAMAAFWDACPRLEPMRGVVTEVVSHRRSAAALHDVSVAEIKARYDTERTAIWSWMTTPTMMSMTLAEVRDMADASLARSREVTQAETAEITSAMRENYADVERCVRLLYWHAERESLKSRCS